MKLIRLVMWKMSEPAKPMIHRDLTDHTHVLSRVEQMQDVILSQPVGSKLLFRVYTGFKPSWQLHVRWMFAGNQPNTRDWYASKVDEIVALAHANLPSGGDTISLKINADHVTSHGAATSLSQLLLAKNPPVTVKGPMVGKGGISQDAMDEIWLAMKTKMQMESVPTALFAPSLIYNLLPWLIQELKNNPALKYQLQDLIVDP